MDDESEAFSAKYMKIKLKEEFGSDIVIGTLKGKPSVVMFKTNVDSLLNEFYSQPRNENPEQEKLTLIDTVAKMIRNDIKDIEQDGTIYPSSIEMSNSETALSFLPNALRALLQNIMISSSDVKVASIGQSIVQAAKPRSVLAPLQLGLALQVHHHFGSRFLVDSLHTQGFCASYDEVKTYEKCAAASHGADLPILAPGQFV